MITDAQRAALKEKIEELIDAHDHLRIVAQRADTSGTHDHEAAFAAGAVCSTLEAELKEWIDREL